MTRVLVGKSHLFVSNGLTIAAFNTKIKEKAVILEIPWISQAITPGMAQSSIGGSSEIFEDDDIGDIKQDSSFVLQMSLCRCGNHLAACNEQKQLVVWNVSNSFEVVCIRSVARKALCICFLPDCKQILVADKTGDVYQFQTDTRSCYGNTPEAGVLLLGHLSMILDMFLTPDNQFLLTCDRDEKIRISCFPNCYNIHAFCTGHTEFVNRMSMVGDSSIFISGSGDGSVRFWDYKSGKQVLQLGRESGSSENECLPVKTCVCSSGTQPTLAILYCGYLSVYLYAVETAIPSCTFAQELCFESEPWDVCWDDEGSLWVFGSSPPNYVTKYKANDEGKFEVISDVLVDNINTHCKFFQATTDSNSLVPILFKRAQDYSTSTERVQSTSEHVPPGKRQKTA